MRPLMKRFLRTISSLKMYRRPRYRHDILYLSTSSHQGSKCTAVCLQHMPPHICPAARRHQYTSQHGPNSRPLRDFVCNERGCSAKFSLLSRLKKHKQIHLKDKLKCDLCDNQYSTKDGQMTHRMRVHR